MWIRDSCQGPHQVLSNCEWVDHVNEWGHWAVWPTLGQSQNILFWSHGHPPKGLRHGQPRWDLDLSSRKNYPSTLTQPFPILPSLWWKLPASPDRSHPLQLTSHSFVNSFNIHLGSYCVSVLVPGPWLTGLTDSPAGERVGMSLCSSLSRHIPHKVISSENHGFSIASFWGLAPVQQQWLRKSLSFHWHDRILFLQQQQEWQEPYLPRSLWLRLIFTCICIFFVHTGWERMGKGVLPRNENAPWANPQSATAVANFKSRSNLCS